MGKRRVNKLTASSCMLVSTFISVLVCTGIVVYVADVQLLRVPRMLDISRHTKADTESISKRFEHRYRAYQQHCSQSGPGNGSVLLVTGHAPARVSLCVVPKAACTIWLGLLKFLANHDTSNKTLLSYSKYDIHDGEGCPYARYDIERKDKDFIENSVRVMTARDPYTRLWSAYIDKLWLPNFWKPTGVRIINMLRQNPTPLSKTCGHDVTFSEFLQYVIKIGHDLKYWEYDYHWMPATDICNPCKFEPRFIMKQETFLTDFKHILTKVDLLHYTESTLAENEIDKEIKNEVDYVFRIYDKLKKEACMTQFELAKKVWQAMIFNGYLYPDDEFPSDIPMSINASFFSGLIFDRRRKQKHNSFTKKANRHRILSEAYRKISSDQIRSLKQLYKLDFKMFEYSTSPPV